MSHEEEMAARGRAITRYTDAKRKRALIASEIADLAREISSIGEALKRDALDPLIERDIERCGHAIGRLEALLPELRKWTDEAAGAEEFARDMGLLD